MFDWSLGRRDAVEVDDMRVVLIGRLHVAY
jgi:hypothetical protein